MTTPADALTSITKMLQDGYHGTLKLPNRKMSLPTDADTVFAELEFQHDDTGQASLTGPEGKRRYESVGSVTIALFFPLGCGLLEPLILGEEVARIFRGKHSPDEHDVWFRNVTILEQQTSRHAGKFQMNVSFTFEYDQFH